MNYDLDITEIAIALYENPRDKNDTIVNIYIILGLDTAYIIDPTSNNTTPIKTGINTLYI